MNRGALSTQSKNYVVATLVLINVVRERETRRGKERERNEAVRAERAVIRTRGSYLY